MDAPTPHVVSDDQQAALDVAARMIAAGVPVFAAPPCASANGGQCRIPGHAGGKHEFDLPPKWQLTVPSPVWLEKWQPGWALAAVGGHAADFLDVDPRHGGDASEAELIAGGQLPRVYGVAQTPSGGRHYLIAPLREREANGFMPGLDYQGGDDSGQGRAFVWIAPTVKRSKAEDNAGELRPYRWEQLPDLEWLAEGGDESGAMIVSRLQAHRAKEGKRERGPDTRHAREFTEAEARAFCNITLERLKRAQIGTIEEHANACAAQLSHFVPDFWPEEFAYAVLTAALTETAYDPDHPASGWDAEKFHAVLNGERERSPLDWKAVRKPEIGEPLPAPEADAVEALLAEMLKPSELKERARKQYLVKGLLSMDSETWLIGAPGSRKSFVALDMAAHVAAGREWQGLKTWQSGVVIIAAEGSGGLGDRIRAWEIEHGAMSDTIRVLPRPVQSANAGAWAVLVEACRRLEPGLVVVDTQARVTVGLKENDATDMGIFINAVSALREATGACVLAVHHTGRQGGDARGSSAIDGAQDTELKVVASKERLRGELRVEKQKDLPEREPLRLMFRMHVVGKDEDGANVTSLVLAGQDAWLESETAPEEPEEWETGHALAIVQLFKVLRDQGGDTGLTKAEARAAVVERFYGGQGAALKKTTYYTAWSRGQGKAGAAGDPVMVNVRGERWVVDTEALETLPARE